MQMLHFAVLYFEFIEFIILKLVYSEMDFIMWFSVSYVVLTVLQKSLKGWFATSPMPVQTAS